MISGIAIRSFGPSDVSRALKLSNAAGWNQVADDWHRIVDLEPAGCLGAWSDDELVGTTTFVTYGARLAWIGMVLVHPAFRRKGIARHLLDETLARLQSLGVQAIGLDATELGRPLYENGGFVALAPIIRWQGVPNPAIPAGLLGSRHLSDSPAPGSVVRTARDEDLNDIVSLDRTLCGQDRRSLLEHLFHEDRTVVLMHEEGNSYGVLRPGRLAWHLGPMVVQEHTHAAELIAAAADVLRGSELVIDSVEKSGYGRVFLAAGLEPRRRLVRMTYSRPVDVLTNEYTAAATSFAWG